MAKTHPHIDAPTVERLEALVEGRAPAVVQVYLAFHGLILEALPDVKVSVDTVDGMIGYGAHQYGYNGWGLGAVAPYSAWVSLHLFDGSRLEDPQGLLGGTAKMRHVKLGDPVKVGEQREGIIALVRAAALLHAD